MRIIMLEAYGTVNVGDTVDAIYSPSRQRAAFFDSQDQLWNVSWDKFEIIIEQEPKLSKPTEPGSVSLRSLLGQDLLRIEFK